MGIDKLHKFELIGGLLVLVLGVTNIIQLLLVGGSDPKGIALFLVYGLLFLIGGAAFFVVCIKEMTRPKLLLGATSNVLLLMCPISNAIYLIAEFGILDPTLVIISVINIILCIIALPLTFIRYVDLENMDTREKISHASLVLLRGSGIFHLLQPVLYPVSSETLGMLIFGTIYLLITILLTSRKEVHLIQLLGFVLPLVGAVLGIGLLFMAPENIHYVIVFIIFDLIISPIRLYYIKTQPAE